MALPLVKFGTLLIKQLSKPLANSIKNTVKRSSNEYLKKCIVLPAQGYHKLEQHVRMRLMGWDKKIHVKPLSEQAALDLGAELLGEFVIFGVAVAVLYSEVKRGQRKEQKKEDDQNDKLIGLQVQISELSAELSKQNSDYRTLHKIVGELQELQEKEK